MRASGTQHDDPLVGHRGTLVDIPPLAVLTGLLTGVASQLGLLLLLIFALFAVPEHDPEGDAFIARIVAPGCLGLALACGLAARVCWWRCRPRDLAPRTERLAVLLAGGATGAIVLGLGLVLRLRWTTIPFYLLAVIVGLATERLTARRYRAKV